jgi:ureidoacrylate peracid hydrolase
MSFRDRIRPGITQRTEFALESRHAALLVIDIQQALSVPSQEWQTKDYLYCEALPKAIHAIGKLVQAFRVVRDDEETMTRNGCEVIFTYLQSMTRDSRDISLDYQLSGPLLANLPSVMTPMENLFLPELMPSQVIGKGDILLPKTSCSVFQSTNLDYLLRNLQVQQLVIVGQLTNQCVESAVRDAADLGYLVTVVEDACAARSPPEHWQGLSNMKGFARILQSTQVLTEIVEDLAMSLEKSEEKTVGNSNNSTMSMNDDLVLDYLRNQGMKEAAKQLEMVFEKRKKIQNITWSRNEGMSIEPASVHSSKRESTIDTSPVTEISSSSSVKSTKSSKSNSSKSSSKHNKNKDTTSNSGTTTNNSNNTSNYANNGSNNGSSSNINMDSSSPLSPQETQAALPVTASTSTTTPSNAHHTFSNRLRSPVDIQIISPVPMDDAGDSDMPPPPPFAGKPPVRGATTGSMPTSTSWTRGNGSNFSSPNSNKQTSV